MEWRVTPFLFSSEIQTSAYYLVSTLHKLQLENSPPLLHFPVVVVFNQDLKSFVSYFISSSFSPLADREELCNTCRKCNKRIEKEWEAWNDKIRLSKRWERKLHFSRRVNEFCERAELKMIVSRRLINRVRRRDSTNCSVHLVHFLVFFYYTQERSMRTKWWTSLHFIGNGCNFETDCPFHVSH